MDEIPHILRKRVGAGRFLKEFAGFYFFGSGFTDGHGHFQALRVWFGEKDDRFLEKGALFGSQLEHRRS